MLHLERAPMRTSTSPKTATTRLSGQVYGTLINLSGRRRFTSQRVVLYALLASQGREGALTMASEALATFRGAHAGLVEGQGQLPGVFCEELRQAYFGEDGADEAIRDFIGLAERSLDAIGRGARGAQGFVEQLVECATPLLAVLNRITQVYEELAKRQATQVKSQLTGIMSEIESIAKQARIVSFNAQIVAARARESGREFAVVAGELTQITTRIDELVREALHTSVA